jgi:hypothetical protein
MLNVSRRMQHEFIGYGRHAGWRFRAWSTAYADRGNKLHADQTLELTTRAVEYVWLKRAGS